MNHLIVIRKDGKEDVVPFFKRKARLLNQASAFLNIEKENIEKIEMVVDGIRQKYSVSKYPKFVDNTNQEILKFFSNEIKSTSQLDMMFDSYKIVHRYRDKINMGVFELMQFQKKIIKKEKSSSDYGSYRFSTITQVKANGKVKKRYICIANKIIAPNQRYVKDVMEKLVTLEPEMLGLGKGVKESIDYFNDFETIVKIDFKDFFNQTTYKMLLKALREHSVIKTESIIKEIADICCPYSAEKKSKTAWQGLSTSTIASYIALLTTFRKIKKHLAENYDTTPVIYIDDLSFGIKGGRGLAEKAKKEVMDIIKKDGYVLNKEKCKVLFGNKTFFLGINMQTKKLGTNSYVLNLKAALHNYSKTGITRTDGKYRVEKKYSSLSKNKIQKQEKMVLLGKLNYLKMINQESYEKLLSHQKYGEIIKSI